MVIYKRLIFVLFTIQLLYSDDAGSFEKVQNIPEKLNVETNNLLSRLSYIDKIDIIGWSRNGLLAYRYADDGVSGTIYRFKIVNTINDEIIERDTIESWEAYNEEEVGRYRIKWNSLLEKHNIVGRAVDPCAEIDGNDIILFPLQNYECWFNYSASDYSIVNDETPVYNWKLIIGNEFVQKTITQQITRDRIFVRVRILGYCKSPFENRIAVFVGSVSSHSGNVYFSPKAFGCNMSIGLD